MIPTAAQNFAEAYSSSVAELLEKGALVEAVGDSLSPGSRFGTQVRRTIELTTHAFEFDSSLSCLFSNPLRRVRLPYCYGLLLWSLSGSTDVQSLSYYHDGAASFADCPSQMSGAFGHRIFQAHGNQIAAIAERLRSDQNSRRTTCIVAFPEDNFRYTREYPCAIACHYMIRNDFLRALTFMRSQSALMVLPYDVSSFVACSYILPQSLKLLLVRTHM